jgi:hypothetical protein
MSGTEEQFSLARRALSRFERLKQNLLRGKSDQPGTSPMTSAEVAAPAPPPMPEGFTPMREVLEEDVFVVGYPKSGNTWFQNLVAGVVFGVVPEYAPPVLAIYELVPDVYVTKYYKRYATPMFFKSHNLPQRDYRRVVYLLRDGRDAMVSYFHFLNAQQEPVTYMDLVKNGAFPCKWQDHVEAWLTNPYGSQILTIRYEDLKANCAGELKRFCDFIGIERPPAYLEMIARSADFAKMHKREAEKGLGAENARWSKERFFHRRGEVGSFKDEMPPDALEAFLAEAAPTLKKVGYTL